MGDKIEDWIRSIENDYLRRAVILVIAPPLVIVAMFGGVLLGLMGGIAAITDVAAPLWRKR